MRRYSAGAELDGSAASFRVWAPGARRVGLHLNGREVAMRAAGGGYFEADAAAAHGDRYGFKLDGEDAVLPDPASRFQPDGPHGLSQIVDARRYRWRTGTWAMASRERQVLYEMHTGTFTQGGTWHAAMRDLPRLRDIGVTTIEVMPVAECPGRFNWGYDGVQWFAPDHVYGEPDDLRAFVDEAHALGLAVILDLVYNHFGPDGNYMTRFAPQSISRRHENEWGDALNFDDAGSDGLRAFVIDNARYWIEEFRLDGFRLDAVQQIFDDSSEHIVTALAREARAAAGAREILIIGEHEPQHAELVRPPSRGGWGLDAIWNDDFHHAAVVALTGTRFAYYQDYRGEARELASCARHGFLFQGQHYPWQKKARGRPARDLGPVQTVCYLENHDQVANSADGARLHQRTSPGAFRAMTALLLLGPWMPLLFQGQEFNSSRPFLYFADHAAELAAKVGKGRGAFVRQFRNLQDPDIRLHQPHDGAAFARCVLDDAERAGNIRGIALHRDLLALRAGDAVLSAPGRTADASALDGARALVRYDVEGAGARLLVINLSTSFDLASVSDPLVAPPVDGAWRVRWHSERPEYGGCGMPPLEPLRWDIPGQSAVLLEADA